LRGVDCGTVTPPGPAQPHDPAAGEGPGREGRRPGGPGPARPADWPAGPTGGVNRREPTNRRSLLCWRLGARVAGSVGRLAGWVFQPGHVWCGRRACGWSFAPIGGGGPGAFPAGSPAELVGLGWQVAASTCGLARRRCCCCFAVDGSPGRPIGAQAARPRNRPLVWGGAPPGPGHRLPGPSALARGPVSSNGYRVAVWLGRARPVGSAAGLLGLPRVLPETGWLAPFRGGGPCSCSPPLIGCGWSRYPASALRRPGRGA